MTPFGKMSPFGFMRGWENPFLGPFWRAGKKRAVAPILQHIQVTPDGLTFDFIFNRNVTATDATGLTVDASGGAATLTYASGTGERRLRFTSSRAVTPDEVITVDGDGATTIAAASGGVGLAAFADVPAKTYIQIADGETVLNPAWNPTVKSIAAGDWTADAATVWDTGVAPTAADRVLVMHAVVVEDATAVAAGVLVYTGGSLTFDPAATTKLLVTTLGLADDAALTMGTSGGAVDAAELCELVIRDTALPDAQLDPLQLSNGLLAADDAVVTICGAAKTCEASKLRLSVEPEEGHTTLTFENNIIGWRAGDKIYIPPTEPIVSSELNTAFGIPFEGEVAEVQSVTDNVVTLAAPLTMDHLGAYDDDGTLRFLPHVEILTFNVVIRSETAGATVRGHTAFSGRVDPDIQFCTFKNLARTQDGALDDSVVTNGITTHVGTNQRGRYSLHLHHWWGPATDPNVQTLTFGGTPDGGTFKLVYRVAGVKVETAAIDWNADGATLAANIQSALDTLHGVNEVIVTGTGPFTLTSAGTVRQAVTTINDLTGTAPTVDGGYQGRFHGIAIDDGLKWGFALHEACYIKATGFNIYNVQYSGIQLEAGNEAYNRFEDCLIMRFVGRDPDVSAVCNGITLMEGMDNEIVNCVTAHGYDSVYLPHGIHLDGSLKRSQPDFAGGPYNIPLSRGADLHDGVEGTDYEVIADRGKSQYVNDGNEAYALTKGNSIDHYGGSAGEPAQVISNYKYWAGAAESNFVYGGFQAVTITGLIARKGSVGVWLDAQDAKIIVSDADIQMGDTSYFSSESIGVHQSALNREDCELRIEDSYVNAMLPLRLNYPGNIGNATNFEDFSRATTLVNTLLENPTGQVTQRRIEVGPQLVAASRVPMLPVGVYAFDYQQVAGDNRQFFHDEQGAAEEAICEDDIADDPIFSKYAASQCGLTNAQSFALDGRCTSGELMPAGTAAVDGVIGLQGKAFFAATVDVDGETVTVNTTTAVTTDGTGWSATGSVTGAVGLTYVSGSGTTSLVFTAASTLQSGETVTGAYDADTGDAEIDLTGVLLPDATFSVTNNSEQAGGGASHVDLESGDNILLESDDALLLEA